MKLRGSFTILILILSLLLENAHSEFTVISTSPSPTNDITSVLSKLMKENSEVQNKRIQALETQISQLQNSLITINNETIKIQETVKKLLTCDKVKQIPENCDQIPNRVSGIYLIQPGFSPESFLVWCDMETRGGGWTVFLNRFDGSENFYLNWTEYKLGFGKLTTEFWLGLEHLHHLTGYQAQELLVEMSDWEGKSVHAHYNAFVIGKEEEQYPMKILGAYAGDAGDSLRFHEGMKFTTLDRDNDLRGWANCAFQEKGSWWYNSCTACNPTAKYLKGNVSSSDQWQIMYWDSFRGSSYGLKKMKMMVKPKRN